MSDSARPGYATRFLDAHPKLRSAMAASARFAVLKSRLGIDIDGEKHFVVRGDTLGGEDDLYLDALARGASSHVTDRDMRELFEELDEELRELVRHEIGRPEKEG